MRKGIIIIDQDGIDEAGKTVIETETDYVVIERKSGRDVFILTTPIYGETEKESE